MLLILVSLAIAYLLIAFYLFNTWLYLFRQENFFSQGGIVRSWLVLLGGALLWPVLVTAFHLLMLEIVKKAQTESSWGS